MTATQADWLARNTKREEELEWDDEGHGREKRLIDE